MKQLKKFKRKIEGATGQIARGLRSSSRMDIAAEDIQEHPRGDHNILHPTAAGPAASDSPTAPGALVATFSGTTPVEIFESDEDLIGHINSPPLPLGASARLGQSHTLSSPSLSSNVYPRTTIQNNNHNHTTINNLGTVNNIVNYNSNTVYNFGSIRNSNVNNFVFVRQESQQEKDMSLIRTGDRFVPDALPETQPNETGCTLGTRISPMSQLMGCLESNSTNILWVTGMTGTGKTSIVLTMCRQLYNKTNLAFGGAFFCSRSAGSIYRTNAHYILPTLAVSLATQSPEFAEALATELRRDNRGAQGHASDQMVHLFAKPFAALASPIGRVIFFIDGLDECSNEREVSELLAAIASFRSDVRVRFVLASRLEMYISATSILKPHHSDTIRLDTLDTAEVEADLYLSIVRRFSDNLMWGETWYSEEDVRALAAASKGLFIFAHTAVLYILATKSANGRKARLQEVLVAVDPSPLDALYDLILARVPSSVTVGHEEFSLTQKALACILAARMPLSVRALAVFLKRGVGVIYELLWQLDAVVHVPDDFDMPGLKARHTSFADYLFEYAVHDVQITRTLGDTVLARGCIGVLADQLHFNVSCSRSSYEPNPSAKPAIITLSLEYACVQWIYHVASLQVPSELDAEINNAFRPRFLFWLEVLSVLGQVRDAAMMLLFAASMVRQAELSRFFRDALAFVTFSHEAIERSAPHIYISALPLASKESLIYKDFAPLCDNLVSVETFGINQHGGQLLMTLYGHEDAINSVTYSDDGYLLASCSDDGIVRIWDARTGEYMTTLPQSIKRPVKSIAFAPNRASIVLGTDEGNVCMWNFFEGQGPPRRLYSHSAAVSCVAVSPDGVFIASASRDNTAYLWNAATGETLPALSGHTGEITAVAFAPNGELLSSCALDGTIRIWNAVTGERVGEPLCGHTDGIANISFSPDGTVLASASRDCTIRLWDIQTSRNIATLSGHSDQVQCVQYSPDGHSLVSAACDCTVRLWRLQDGTASASSVVFNGHARPVRSAKFSPDGLFIASGSEDNTIQIWDAVIGQALVQSLPAPDRPVRSLAVSTDGSLIVSGSDDGSVRVWSAQNGEPSLPPLQGHADTVNSVAIISERCLILSASLDHIFNFWDLLVGRQVCEPLRGYDNYISATTISYNARWLASGSSEGAVHVWDGATRRPSKVGPLRCFSGVLAVTFSCNGKFIAAGDVSGHVHIWYVETGQPAREPFQTNQSDMKGIAFSPDGTRILSNGREGKPSIWDVATGQLAFVLVHGMEQVTSAAYSSDGRFIGSGSKDGSISLWDATSGASIVTLHGHEGSVHSVAFTPDNASIVSCSDANIRVWDTSAARLLPSRSADRTLTLLAVTRLDKSWLLGPSGELLLWVPQEYRDCLAVPPCTMLIGRRRVVIKAGSSSLHAGGDNWTSCWRKEPLTAASR